MMTTEHVTEKEAKIRALKNLSQFVTFIIIIEGVAFIGRRALDIKWMLS